MTKTILLSAVSIAMLLALSPVASAAEFGTAAEAKAMLDRAIVELKAGETAAIAKFNSPDGGFRDRDLYVFCFQVTDGKFTAHVNKALVGTDIRAVKERDGSPLGERILKAVKEEITTIEYNFPRPGSDVPVAKQSYLIKIANEGCGVGYYK